MKISASIRASLRELSLDFQEFASLLPAARYFDEQALLDCAIELLNAIADDLESPQSGAQQKGKSRGLEPGHAPAVTSYARRHAQTRLEQGFTLDQVVAEYRALRASIMRLDSMQGTRAPGIEDLVRFNESLDQGLVESIAWYGSQVEHARELFLAILGHDLRNPLGAVTMSAEVLLQDEHLGADSTMAAVRVMNSCRRMGNMIEDLIDFTRTRLGTRLPTQLAVTELRPVIEQTLEELKAFHPRRDIRYDCQDGVKGTWDAARLAQMLSNLVGNAIQHGELDRPVSVKAWAEGEDVVLTVHNEGPPIAADMVARIFEPLMRGVVQEAELRSRRGGLGLGLHISREIARAHGGTIEVASSLESGTTFSVRLPKMQRGPA